MIAPSATSQDFLGISWNQLGIVKESTPVSSRLSIFRILLHEDINFLLTNRIPRLALTRFMGWFSKREHPLVRRVSLSLWRLFCDVDLTNPRIAIFAVCTPLSSAS